MCIYHHLENPDLSEARAHIDSIVQKKPERLLGPEWNQYNLRFWCGVTAFVDFPISALFDYIFPKGYLTPDEEGTVYPSNDFELNPWVLCMGITFEKNIIYMKLHMHTVVYIIYIVVKLCYKYNYICSFATTGWVLCMGIGHTIY